MSYCIFEIKKKQHKKHRFTDTSISISISDDTNGSEHGQAGTPGDSKNSTGVPTVVIDRWPTDIIDNIDFVSRSRGEAV